MVLRLKAEGTFLNLSQTPPERQPLGTNDLPRLIYLSILRSIFFILKRRTAFSFSKVELCIRELVIVTTVINIMIWYLL